MVADEAKSSPIIDKDSMVGSSMKHRDKTGSRRSDSPAATNAVLVWPRAGSHHARHGLRPAAGTMIFFILSLGSADPDSAGRRIRLPWKIIDCEECAARPARDRRKCAA